MRKEIRLFRRVVVVFGVLIILMFTTLNIEAASSKQYDEVHIQFHSSDHTILNGSLLIPHVPGPHPAVILIHGAGWHDREDYRAEAEIFVQSGIAAFIYDKRTDGYSPDGIGEHSRSYAMLADDVLAAVDVLRIREELDWQHIGLWGLSEGSSVAPLAAVQSNDIAFVIAVSASGVSPAQQTSWQMENMFRQQGIRANSFLHSMTRTGMRFLVSAGLFAEATYNHVPPLEAMQQPLLAIWGSNDRTTPPVENFQIMKEALERGGNEHFTLQFIPNANHDLRLSPDGFSTSEQFAPGYAEAIVSWVEKIVEGEGAGKYIIGNIPQQSFTSFVGIDKLAWYDSAWAQLAMMVILFIIFFSFIIFLVGKRQTKVERNRLHWYAGVIAISGTISMFGFFAYFGYIMMTNHPGPILIGIPVPWLTLQLFSIVTIVFAVLLAVTARYDMRKVRYSARNIDKVQLGLQLIGGMFFIIWAFYWKLLFPLF